MQNRTKSAYTTILALIVWFGLALQFYISTEKYMAGGRSLTDALIQIISFYTIQTNLLIAIALTAILLKPAGFFSRATVLTALAVYITIVGLIYAVILRGQWKPEGLFKLADNLLHTLSPILYIVYWLTFVPKEHIRWKQMFAWALFPLFYLVYSLIRGSVTGDYPYNFINASMIPYQQIAINALGVLMLFLILSTLFIFLKRNIPGHKGIV